MVPGGLQKRYSSQGLILLSNLAWFSIVLFLLFNVYVNGIVLLTYNQRFLYLGGIVVCLCLAAFRKQTVLYLLLIVLGFLLFLFGFRSYDIQSRFF